jgi:hypothetical protein
MAISEVGICNSALIKVGAKRITALNEATEQARICNEQYAKVRDDLLYSHPWNFAITRVELAADSTQPISEWDNQFPLPSDCLRVIGTDLLPDDSWHVEGRNLMANTDTVIITYVKQITDVTKFTPGFAEALSAKLAADLSYALSQSSSLRATLVQEAERAIMRARSFDAQESQGDRVYADSWLNARN